ncbi:MAG: GGDEF domain-containing protein [Desulfovibrio sp.]|jgi:diguanylate cyclase (GGDEF)-like protein|nr:GGDEF domain-containing protein [Desulfovibrio sp.]
MNKEHTAVDILQALDMAVLRRIGPEEYRLLDNPPDFYGKFFPSSEAGPCNAPWEHSDMLQFFYETAEVFFTSGEIGIISSGSWEEEGLCEQNQALMADAVSFGGTQAIIVRLLTESYTRQLDILRKARTLLFERSVMVNDIERYKQRSRVDGLTKLLNKTSFMEQLEAGAVQANDMGEPLSLIMMDIDNFKQINDTYGHQTGDLVLSTLGKILLSNLRREDCVGRYGGEEFIVAIPGVPEEQLLQIAEKLRKKTAAYVFDPSLPVITVSVGCSVYRNGEGVEECIRRADTALYEAKHSGKNTVRLL